MKQHYVPQFYERNFTTTNTKGTQVLWVYDKDGGEPREQTPYNTMAEHGFYSFENSTGDIDAVDKGLQRLESLAAPILARLQKPDVELTVEEIFLLAHFLAIMYARVPRTIKAVAEKKEIEAFERLRWVADRPDLLRRFRKEHQERFGRDVPGEGELIDLLRTAEKHFRVEVDPKAALLDALKVAPVIAEFLYYRMNWCICRAPKDVFFITSDMPVCIFLPTGRGRGIFGGGIGQPDVEISFPVSPKILILIDYRHTQHHMAVSEAFVHMKNTHMSITAERWVISHLRSRYVEQLMRKASVTRSNPKLHRETVGRMLAEQMRKDRADLEPLTSDRG